MSDPYKILGVSSDATDADIKKAYRELAKKYHPDNYHDNPLGELANEKMKEINEAYDEIQKLRSASSYSGSAGSSYGGYSYSSQSSSSARPDLQRIRDLIAAGNYAEASIVCDSVSQNMRNAEWHYLKSLIYLRQGSYYNAVQMLNIAVRMDPTNAEYNRLYQTLVNNQNRHGGFSADSRSDYGCSICDACTGLMCADCLCECCGGDLIACC